MNIVEHDGWWWPSDDVECRAVIFAEIRNSLPQFLAEVSGRLCVVQAGGNVGVLPKELAKHFRRVITAEPDADNCACLWRNTHGIEAIDARNVAFGEAYGACRPVVVTPGNCGAHRVDRIDGDGVVMMAIDDLGLVACDAIWLDIEGYELFALKGAVQTIDQFSPVICIEDKGLSRTYGVELGEAGEWLAARGYEQVTAFGRDKLYRRTSNGV